MKKQNGVSLITLVITIVIAIILSSIALSSGVLNIGDKAQFLSFDMEISQFRDNIKTRIADIGAQMMSKDPFTQHAISKAQFYNFVARGLADRDFDFLSRENRLKMLTEEQANAIPCTIIEKNYAEEYLSLKDRKVDTYYANKQELSYFITPLGNVFCWPPYSSDGRSYVDGITAAKSMTGEDLKGSDATNPSLNPTVKITFLNGEEIIVSNSAPSNNNISKGSQVIDRSLPSIWYSEETRSNEEHVKKYGVAQGYTFEGYDRSQ